MTIDAGADATVIVVTPTVTQQKGSFLATNHYATTVLLGRPIRDEQDSDWVSVTLFSVSDIQRDLIQSELRTGDFLSRFREVEFFHKHGTFSCAKRGLCGCGKCIAFSCPRSPLIPKQRNLTSRELVACHLHEHTNHRGLDITASNHTLWTGQSLVEERELVREHRKT